MLLNDSEEWIGVDLDGTLSIVDHSIPYCRGLCPDVDGLYKPHIIGPPAMPMVRRVQGWLAAGRKVKVFTARVAPPLDAIERVTIIAAIQRWTLKHIGQALEVTNCKDIHMTELWDDRAVKVRFNQGEPL